MSADNYENSDKINHIFCNIIVNNFNFYSYSTRGKIQIFLELCLKRLAFFKDKLNILT